MNTPSHFLMTVALAKGLGKIQRFQPMPLVKVACLWGSIAPDLPLWMLSITGILYYHYWLGWTLAATTGLMFDKLYFEHPLWIALHNGLHAPIVLAVGLTLTYKLRSRSHQFRWFFWFFLACLLHSIVDILTHVDDGPLLFFPFDWQTRFRSSISYYDDRYSGREFSRFELAIDLLFFVYGFGFRLYQGGLAWGRQCYRWLRLKGR